MSVSHRGFISVVSVVQTLESTIHWINHHPVDLLVVFEQLDPVFWPWQLGCYKGG